MDAACATEPVVDDVACPVEVVVPGTIDAAPAACHPPLSVIVIAIVSSPEIANFDIEAIKPVCWGRNRSTKTLDVPMATASLQSVTDGDATQGLRDVQAMFLRTRSVRCSS